MEGLKLLPKAKQKYLNKCIKIEKYKLIKEKNTQDKWSVVWLCEKLGVSKAAYYKWCNRKVTNQEVENSIIIDCISGIATSNNRLFGAQKMLFVVNKKLNKKYNLKRIRRLMCIHDLNSIFRPSNPYNWKRSEPQVKSENILNREFEVSKPNEVWCTDVTEIQYPGIPQKVYISSYIDLYDRSVLGIAVSHRNDCDLTQKSIEIAINANQGAKPMHHSDQGFQYTREFFKKFLDNHGIKQSMSRVGRCIDNGPMECFQGILKEMLNILYPNLKTYEELEQAIYKTVDYYHNEYPQTRFNGLTSLEVRNIALKESNPKRYPITPNPKVTKYWKRIDALKNKNQVEINPLG